jgi:hypothetical protein
MSLMREERARRKQIEWRMRVITGSLSLISGGLRANATESSLVRNSEVGEQRANERQFTVKREEWAE